MSLGLKLQNPLYIVENRGLRYRVRNKGEVLL